MGSVWVADHLTLDTEVVVKFIGPGLRVSPEASARFSREAAAAAKVKSPHVVQVLDHGTTTTGVPFIVMELLEGEDLATRLRRTRTLPPTDVVTIVSQIGHALARAHARGIIHRDVKPGNIFLCESESEGGIFAKLLDFGIAKADDARAHAMTTTGRFLGSPYYMSPEQALGAGSVDQRADIWSIGVVAYEALTGVLPVTGETVGAIAVELAIGAPPVPPSHVNGALPPAVDAWFARACARKREDRFASTNELVAALREAFALPPERESIWNASAPPPSVPPSGPSSDAAPTWLAGFAHGPETIRLGDLEVKRLGFGAMQLPGPFVWGEPTDPSRARAVLRRALELGIDLVDTAWYYGPHVANRLIAETLHPYPAGLVLATKLGGKRMPDKGWGTALRPEELREGCEEDLRTLRLERIDVAHLRWSERTDVPFREAFDAMIALRNEGKIRHLALSNVTLAQLREALSVTPVVAVQNLYNVAAGARRLGKLPLAVVADQEEILALCEERGIAFLPFFPLSLPGARTPAPAVAAIAKRRGASEAQVALAWLLARSPVMLPIPGTSSPQHLEENWSARSLWLSPGEVASITESRR
jgi:aryl-alcohol dehydrogenase-like predicted oxidoreductase